MGDKPQNKAPQASLLGKAVAYRSDYAPELLFPISREDKRIEIGVTPAKLPFHGYDLWNAYEISWLNPKGKPVVAIGRFSVPAETPCLIESKSLKLYLNSFNQTAFDSAQTVLQTISRDLSEAAGGAVSVTLGEIGVDSWRQIGVPEGVNLDQIDIAIDCYQPAPGFLETDSVRTVQNVLLYSHLLKSNCLVTGQPDWAMVAIRYSGREISQEGLLRYIVSFREHNEFHEQCVERIYTDIMRRCQPDQLEVWARYTRRGGLDINPYRASFGGGEMPALDEVRQ